jgi:hypothetical protein
MPDIDFGPNTFFASGTKLLQPGLFIMCLLLTVNPAIAKRYIKRFRVADGLFPRTFFEYFEPDAIRIIVILLKPRFKCPGCFKFHYWKRIQFSHYLRVIRFSIAPYSWRPGFLNYLTGYCDPDPPEITNGSMDVLIFLQMKVTKDERPFKGKVNGRSFFGVQHLQKNEN